jgi:hypothetical protein
MVSGRQEVLEYPLPTHILPVSPFRPFVYHIGHVCLSRPPYHPKSEAGFPGIRTYDPLLCYHVDFCLCVGVLPHTEGKGGEEGVRI